MSEATALEKAHQQYVDKCAQLGHECLTLDLNREEMQKREAHVQTLKKDLAKLTREISYLRGQQGQQTPPKEEVVNEPDPGNDPQSQAV